MQKTIAVSLPPTVVELIDKVRDDRQDPCRSHTIRVLLLQQLASMSYLGDEAKKALGMNPR